MTLTDEEKRILDSVERDEWRRVPDFDREAVRYGEAARAGMRKDKRVNIRMTARDMARFKKAAVREGLPYQTLISSVLHKYISGRLVDRKDG